VVIAAAGETTTVIQEEEDMAGIGEEGGDTEDVLGPIIIV
jgi:hypothetical protein